MYIRRKVKMKGVLVRAKARWIEEGERPTRYFCGLEKRQYTKKYISSLEINGKHTHDQTEILRYLKYFFEDAYKSKIRYRTCWVLSGNARAIDGVSGT